MSNIINRALLLGLGLASLTKDAIQETAADLVRQSKMSEKEGRKLAKDLHRRSEQAQKALEKHVDKAVHEVLKHMDLPAVITDRLKGLHGKRKSAKKTHPPRKTHKANKVHKTAKS